MIYPTIFEAGMLLWSLEREQEIRRILRVVFTYPPGPADQSLSGQEFLTLCVADWLTAFTQLKEMERTLLLKEFALDVLGEWAEQLEQLKEGVRIQPMILGLVESSHATWPGRREFWDIPNATWVPKLPRPGLYTVAVDLMVLYQLSLRQLEELRKSRQRSADDVHRVDKEVPAPGEAGG